MLPCSLLLVLFSMYSFFKHFLISRSRSLQWPKNFRMLWFLWHSLSKLIKTLHSSVCKCGDKSGCIFRRRWWSTAEQPTWCHTERAEAVFTTEDSSHEDRLPGRQGRASSGWRRLRHPLQLTLRRSPSRSRPRRRMRHTTWTGRFSGALGGSESTDVRQNLNSKTNQQARCLGWD